MLDDPETEPAPLPHEDRRDFDVGLRGGSGGSSKVDTVAAFLLQLSTGRRRFERFTRRWPF